MRFFCCPQHSEYSQFRVVANLFVVNDEPGIHSKYIIKVFIYIYIYNLYTLHVHKEYPLAVQQYMEYILAQKRTVLCFIKVRVHVLHVIESIHQCACKYDRSFSFAH